MASRSGATGRRLQLARHLDQARAHLIEQELLRQAEGRAGATARHHRQAAARIEGHGDAARFARDYIPTLRSWSEPVFAAGLDAKRNAEERAAIIDAFYGRYERLVAASPAGHGMDYVHIYLVLRKLG